LLLKGASQNRSGEFITDVEPKKIIRLKQKCPLCDGSGEIDKPHGDLYLFCPLDWGKDDIRGDRAMCDCPYCHKRFSIFEAEQVRGDKSVKCTWCSMEYRLKHVGQGENSAHILVDAVAANMK